MARDTVTHGKKCRWIKRVTPITLTAHATEDELIELAKTVLKPHFHDTSQKKVQVLSMFITYRAVRHSAKH
jgi:hypothetical protein